MTDADTITLGAITITPPKGAKMGVLAPLVIQAFNPEAPAAVREAAVLAFCWESGAVESSDPKVTTKPPAKYRDCRSSPVRYGEAALEALISRGFKIPEIVSAGVAAAEALAPAIIGETEVKEEAGN